MVKRSARACGVSIRGSDGIALLGNVSREEAEFPGEGGLGKWGL